MDVQKQIEEHLSGHAEPKRSDLRQLHDMILRINPTAKLWFLDGKNDEGKVVARVDYSEKRQLYEIRAYDASGSQRVIYTEETSDPALSIVGFAEKEGTLIATHNQDSDFVQMYEMSLADGKLTGPLRTRANAEIEGIIRDENHVVVGVSYSGLYPSYDLFDPTLNADVKGAINAFTKGVTLGAAFGGTGELAYDYGPAASGSHVDRPQVVALTATATPEVREDILRSEKSRKLRLLAAPY